MSGETEQNVSDWKVDSLHEHLQKLLNARDKYDDERDLRYQQRFEAQERSADSALTAMDKRLEGMNEFRDEFREQAGTFATNERLDAATASMRDKLDTFMAVVDARLSAVDTRVGQSMPRTEIASRFAGYDTLMNAVQSQLATMQGRSTGLNAGWGYLAGAVGLLGTVISIVLLIR